jgi:hypothetical protein
MQFDQSTLSTLALQYSERLGLDWKRRNTLFSSPRARFSQLVILDDNMANCIRGLSSIGDTSPESLIKFDANKGMLPRDVFSLVIQACETFVATDFMACVTLVEAMPHLSAAFLDAMDWVSPLNLHVMLKDWHSDSELHRLTTLRLVADPRFDFLELTVEPPQSPAELRLILRAARLRARPDYVQASYESSLGTLDDDVLRQLCAHHLLFDQGKREQIRQYVEERILRSDEDAEHWIPLLFNDPTEAGEELTQALLSKPGMERRYIVALGWLGRSEDVPALIDLLDSPEWARIAGAALSMITGPIQETGERLTAVPKSLASDQLLPELDKKQFVSWWEKNKHLFDPDARYLLGQNKKEPGAMLQLLREAVLPWRPFVAGVLQCLNSACVFDTHAPAFRQCVSLAHLESVL